MNLLTFTKRKKPNASSKPKKAVSKQTMPKQMDTEMYPMKQQNTLTETPKTNNQKTSSNSQKHKINTKEVSDFLWKMQAILQQEYDQVLQRKSQQTHNQVVDHLLKTDFFRFQKVDKSMVLERYERVIQGSQLLMSKLKNNQTVKDHIYVANSEEFLLFFKSLFGKPYTFCNMPSNRKVLEVLWQNEIFPNKRFTRCVENIRLWVYGIALPINPSAISLHRLVLTNPEMLTRALKFSKNQHLYIHINRSDSLGMTPFLLAVKSIPQKSNQKSKAIEKLIKNGCDIFSCPLTYCNTGQEKRIKEKRMNKVKILFELPLKQRKQTNAIEHLFSKKLFRNVADILYFDEIRAMKQLRNDKNIGNLLKQIPDCSFQVDWKTYKGMLSFKTLPKDIISLYKRQNLLRVDYHVNDLEQLSNKKNEHYSLLLKADKPKPEFYLINHHERKITDLLHELNPKVIKKRYETFFHSGNVQNQEIIAMKCQFNGQTQSMQASATFSHENIKMSERYPITNPKEYQQAIINSNLIDYAMLEKSELKSVIMENACNQSQVKDFKSKIFRNSVNFDVEWRKQKLNLMNLSLILQTVGRQNPLLRKISKIATAFLTEELLLSENFNELFPYKFKLQLQQDLNIQAEIKNLNYTQVDMAAFSLQYRAIENDYDYEPDNEMIASLQSTVVMDQLYSLNVSRFVGKDEREEQLEEEEANRKFQELLMQEISVDLTDFHRGNQSSEEQNDF